MSGPSSNWAGNIAIDPTRVHRPSTVDELRRVVAGSPRVRALGTGHSFSGLVDAPGDLVSVAGLPPTIEIDAVRATVRVAGGVRYGELALRLHATGYALPNLASLPHISVAGSVATGTHGSGDRNGSLATAVSAMELVTAGGDLVAVGRDDADGRFAGTVVALGALGVVTSLELDIVPAFEVRQDVYDDLPYAELTGHLAEIMASAYSVSLFTDWTGPRVNHMWLKRRVDGGDPWTPPRRWLGATLADRPRHPIDGMPVGHSTEQLGRPGPWYARLPHFRLDFLPSSGAELQSEYLVPRSRAVEALDAIDGIRDRVAPILQVSEIRTVAADELWLSPCYRRDTLAIHFTWVKDPRAVAPVLAALEERLAPVQARPHWGKLFGTSPETIRGLYERWPDFQRLLASYDPAGKFRNDFINRYFPASG